MASFNKPFVSLLAFFAVLSPATVIPPQCVEETVLVGNGDPHQNYFHMQVSENLECAPQAACSVSHLTSHTVGWSASAGIAQWITGGFSVDDSVTTGNTYTCDGNPGDEVCVWVNIPHTAYTVQNFNENCGGAQGDPVVVKSPNSNWDSPTGYYCVVGTCRSEGESYWDNSGPAGGPP